MVRVELDDLALAKAGDRAAAGRVVAGIRPLVVQIAAEYAKRTPGVETDDLIQEGYIAVLSAVKWFRPELGFQFSTYAADCVRRRLVGWLRDPRFGPVAGLEQTDDKDETNDDGAAGSVPEAPSEERPGVELARSLLASLDIVSRTVVRLRHGLDGENPLTFQEVADRVGLGLGSVQRLYESALQAMRGPSPAHSN